MYLDAHKHNWSWTALYMNSHIFFSFPHILSFLIWCTWNNCTNVIVSYGVYSCPHAYSFLMWRIKDIYHDTYHSQFNHISCRFHIEVVILDHHSSFIEVSTSNDILSVIAIENINHLTINEFILVLFRR